MEIPAEEGMVFLSKPAAQEASTKNMRTAGTSRGLDVKDGSTQMDWDPLLND